MEAATALIAPPAIEGIEWVLNRDPRDVTIIVLAGTITTSEEQRIADLIASAPEPRGVMAFGVCASSGGPYWDSDSVVAGWASADHFVPGCPPPPHVFWQSVAATARAVLHDAC